MKDAPAEAHRVAAPVRARSSRVALVAVLALGLASRLVGLVALPQFLDESWHLSWSLKVASGMSLLRPWLAGRALSIAAGALVLPWVRGHELAASRGLTIAFSLLTVAAVFALARRLYDERTATVAALFYILCPFTLFHDRLFLADPVLSTFVALALLGSFELARHGRERDGALTGLALTLAALSKASGVLLLFVPAAAWLCFARPLRSAWRALAVAYAVALSLLAAPFWYYLQKSSTVRITFAGSSAPPLERTAHNLALVGEWLWGWGTAPLCLLALAAIAVALARRRAPSLFLAAVTLVPVAVFVPTAVVWYPRYILFVPLPALVLSAHALVAAVDLVCARRGLSARARTALLVVAATLALVPAAAVDLRLWTDPSRARMPAIERFQYVEGWPSGYGVRDTVARVAQERAASPEGLTVVVRSRALPTTVMALSVAFRRDPGVRIEDLPLDETAKAVPLLEAWARERPTLVVVSAIDGGSRPSVESWKPLGVELLAETRKPNGQPCDSIYRITPAAP